jgi:hypothetical protein
MQSRNFVTGGLGYTGTRCIFLISQRSGLSLRKRKTGLLPTIKILNTYLSNYLGNSHYLRRVLIHTSHRTSRSIRPGFKSQARDLHLKLVLSMFWATTTLRHVSILRDTCLSIRQIPPSQCHHMSLMEFVVSPPGCGRRVTDFRFREAHKAQLPCSDEADGDIWIYSTRRGLKPKFY